MSSRNGKIRSGGNNNKPNNISFGSSDQFKTIQTNVFAAASNGKLFRIKKFLQRYNKEEVKWLLSQEVDNTTPLIVACRHGYIDVVNYFIQHCGVDIEQVGSVTFDKETIEGAPPLWCAAAAGHFTTVEVLVKNGAMVNHTTFSNSTPLRAACFDGHFEIVKYLVNHGADIELANRHGHTCLMISCYKNHYPIVEYLLKLGADVNRRSVRGNTALHDCAESGSLEIMKLLLKNHAKMDLDAYGMSPIKAAAVAGHTNIVDYLVSRQGANVTMMEKIEALELSGAMFVDKKRDMQSALKYWNRAIELRYADATKVLRKKKVPPVAAYEYAKEVETLQDLDNMICEPDEMRMQALLIRERILGPAHPDTTYYIRYRGAVYADSGNFHRCMILWMYALKMQQESLEPLNAMTQSSLLSFAELFAYMVEQVNEPSNPTLTFNDVFTVYEKATWELFRFSESRPVGPLNEKDMTGYNRVITIVLHLLSLVIKTEKTATEDEIRELKQVTYKLIKMDFREKKGAPLLHLALDDATSEVGKYPVCKFPDHKVAHCLLECGANPNDRDMDENISLHIAVQNLDATIDPTESSNILKTVEDLLQHGAHFDTVNRKGQTFLDLSQDIRTNIQAMKFTSLRCLVSRVIVKFGMDYKGLIPKRLESFVELH